ncbi:adipokinetic hormone/corazonin-related peptide receptor variant I-like [Haliotis rubra]|uniref:adipokinetic hormone/corazonin-related peptide receptor variant I-like n=1 Tax=Haliotis rubra TaxID=36100 RepID=UPI001EE51BFE|nr:adipokinetic hormone/corazonin-related peptide receptor variant I-like [Haliotis rubra]
MDMESANISDYTYDYDYDSFIQTTTHTTEIVVTSVLLYIGVCTNIWMIRSLYKSWKTGSRMHFYLLAICVADLLGLCISSGVSIGSNATVVWRGGYYGCKIFSGLQMFGTTMSHLILAGFNIDNLFTITCSRSIKALRIVFLLLSFATALTMSGVKFYFYQLRPMGHSNEAYYCGFGSAFGYALLPLVDTAVFFLLPFLMMLLFGLPSLFVWCCKKGTLSYEKMTSDDDSSTDVQFIGRDIGIVLAYDLVFFLCIAPFIVLWVLGWHTITVFTILGYLWVINPCVNPFIYAIFNCIGRRREKTSPGL